MRETIQPIDESAKIDCLNAIDRRLDDVERLLDMVRGNGPLEPRYLAMKQMQEELTSGPLGTLPLRSEYGNTLNFFSGREGREDPRFIAFRAREDALEYEWAKFLLENLEPGKEGLNHVKSFFHHKFLELELLKGNEELFSASLDKAVQDYKRVCSTDRSCSELEKAHLIERYTSALRECPIIWANIRPEVRKARMHAKMDDQMSSELTTKAKDIRTAWLQFISTQHTVESTRGWAKRSLQAFLDASLEKHTVG